MALPSVLTDVVRRRRRARGILQQEDQSKSNQPQPPRQPPNRVQIRRSTRPRRISIGVASACFILSLIFNLVVVLGSLNKSTLTNVYFYKLDLSNIIPASVPNADLINSIARTIGLHDFYQVGMWGFCEGYINEGVTDCSKPQNLYWFNPVEVILNELLSGATIALPSTLITILDVLRISSNVMFGCFISALVMNFVLVFTAPVALLSHWWSVPIGFAAFLSSVLLFCAAVIATVTSLAFKYAAMSQSDLNISADVGTEMFAFMWLAFCFGWLAFAIHAGLGCCCTSVRDVQRGRKPIVEPENELGPEPGQEASQERPTLEASAPGADLSQSREEEAEVVQETAAGVSSNTASAPAVPETVSPARHVTHVPRQPHFATP